MMNNDDLFWFIIGRKSAEQQERQMPKQTSSTVVAWFGVVVLFLLLWIPLSLIIGAMIYIFKAKDFWGCVVEGAIYGFAILWLMFAAILKR